MRGYLCGRTNRAHLTIREGGNSAAAGHKSLAAQTTFPWQLCCAGIGFGDCGLHPTGCLRHGFFLTYVILLVGPKMTTQKGMSWAGRKNFKKNCALGHGKCGAVCCGCWADATPCQIRAFRISVNSPPIWRGLFRFEFDQDVAGFAPLLSRLARCP
jgi:hypothetical protein